MDGMTHVKLARRLFEFGCYLTLFHSIQTLVSMSLRYQSGQVNKDTFLLLSPLLLNAITCSMGLLITNIRWKLIYLAFQLLFTIFMVRSLIIMSNS